MVFKDQLSRKFSQLPEVPDLENIHTNGLSHKVRDYDNDQN